MANTRGRVFYGWWVLLACIAGLAFSWATVTVFSFGLFVKPLEAAFGWSRGDISLGLSVVTLTSVASSPLVGALMDRFGARRVLMFSIVLFASSFGSLYWLTDRLWHFYLALFLVPALGAAASPLGYSQLIVNWFDRRRGLALGIGLAGVGLGAILLPSLTQSVIAGFGWREAYLTLAVLAVAVGFPVVALVVRDKPADLGLHPDGDEAPAGALHASAAGPAGFPIRQALGLRSFRLIAAMIFFAGLAFTGLILHLVPLLIDRGFSPAAAAMVQSSFGLSLLVGRVSGGYLMDRFFAPYVALGFLTAPLIAVILLATGAAGSWAYLVAVLIGLGLGAEFDVMGYFTSRYFGLVHYGVIYGFLFAAFQLGSTLGPVIMGYGFDATGSYIAPLWVLAASFATACVLVTLLGPYPKLPAPEPAASGGRG